MGAGGHLPDAQVGDSYEELLALDETIKKKGLNAEALHNYTHVQVLSEEDVKRMQQNSSERCVICQDDYSAGDEVRRLPCLCCFHRACVDTYFKENTKCPICRLDVKGEEE